MKAILNFIFSKVFLKNVGIALGILLFFFLFTFSCMRIYTGHNRSYAVNDFIDMPLEKAIPIVENRNFRYEIFDSLYVPEKEPGQIIDQHPKPGKLVKKNRKIFFTINSSAPEKIAMPRLEELTLREGKAKLESFGLMLGELSYRYDLSRNVILEQRVNGKVIEPGDSIRKGTYIDLVLGKGLGHEKAKVPDLIGLTEEEAKILLADALFSLGYTVPDASVDPTNDTLLPKIFRQKPVSDASVLVPLGSTITIWVTNDSTKLPMVEQPEELLFPKDDDEETTDDINNTPN